MFPFSISFAFIHFRIESHARHAITHWVERVLCVRFPLPLHHCNDNNDGGDDDDDNDGDNDAFIHYAMPFSFATMI